MTKLYRVIMPVGDVEAAYKDSFGNPVCFVERSTMFTG